MRQRNFVAWVTQGVEDDNGYVKMQHNQVYKLCLRNLDWSKSCDVQVNLDGKDIGTYRLLPGGLVELERSHTDTGMFTFLRADSTEAYQAGSNNIAHDNRGLIQCRFKPEIEPVYQPVHQHTNSTKSRSYGGACGQGTRSNPTTAGFSVSPAVPLTDCCFVGGRYSPTAYVPKAVSAGITALTGQSDQQFHSVTPLTYDTANEVLISLRLVACDNAPRELKPQPNGNPVPRAI